MSSDINPRIGWIYGDGDVTSLLETSASIEAEIIPLSGWEEVVDQGGEWSAMIIELSKNVKELEHLISETDFGGNTPIIALVSGNEFEIGIDSMSVGASAVIQKEELTPAKLIKKLSSFNNKFSESQENISGSSEGFDNMEVPIDSPETESTNESSYVFVDPLSQSLFALAQRVARADVSVLVQGATGAGKEVLAKVVHQSSQRSQQPYISMNCAAIPENLAEGMLFGHEKGSFTGATRTQKGLFEQANGGTIFLDEIGEMPLALQSKLLRVLQEKTLTRIGGEKSLNLDVRVIAATNRNLTDLISARLFREDLYFRLSAFKLTIPPLASRRLDIAPLVDLMLSKHSDSLGREVGITTSAMNELMHYGWPGNVRELENVISRAIVMSDGDHIDACHILLDDIRPNDGWQELGDQTASVMQKLISSNPFQDGFDTNTGALGSSVKQTECSTILAALQASKNRAEAAVKLGISPRTLRHKLKKLRDDGMQVPQAYAR